MGINLDSLTNKLMKNINKGDMVLSPIGVWSALAIAGQTYPQTLKNLNVTEQESLYALDTYYSSAKESQELSYTNLAWANDPKLLENMTEIQSINVSSPIPTQTEADALVKDQTQGLIDKFPGDISGADSVFTNIISMILEWKEPFKVIPKDTSLNYWEVDNTMLSRGSQREAGFVGFTKDEEENLFGFFLKSSTSQGCYVISVVSVDDNPHKESALNIAHNIANNNQLLLTPEELLSENISQGNNFTISKQRGTNDSYAVDIPAWDIKSTHVLDNIFDISSDASLIQEAVAQYQVNGFKAAAVTTMIMRSAFLPKEIYHTELKFDKPFASVAMYDTPEWKKTPVFISWTETAVEPKEI